MNIMISIEHPAWVHQFRRIIEALKARGDEVAVLAVKKDIDLELLESFKIPYILLGKSTGRNIIEKGFIFLRTCFTYTREAIRHKPDILIGRASPMMAVAAFLTRRPHVFFEDTEFSRFSLAICRLLSARIITPESFPPDYGEKHIPLPIYKETFYLAPDCFAPDPAVLRESGIDPEEDFVIVRFIAWQASHDFGLKGAGDKDKARLLAELSKRARVYVTSEIPLSPALEPYRLKLPITAVHHALYYAKLVIGEGGTMVSEAAALGTHAVYISALNHGTTAEQEKKYGLIYSFGGRDGYEKGFAKAAELLSDEGLKPLGKEKRARMYADLIDANAAYIRIMDETPTRRS